MYPGKPVTITCNKPGEYNIRRWQVQPDGSLDTVGVVVGAAQAIIFLSRILFEDEANKAIKDQRAESDKIAASVLSDMKQNPSKFIPKKAK